jgi:hypothetical protein
MPSTGGGAYTEVIITPDIRSSPVVAAAYEAQAAAMRAGAVGRQQQAEKRTAENACLRDAVQSRGSEAMHEQHRYAAVDFGRSAEGHIGTAEFLEDTARVMRDVDARHAEINQEAHEKISAAKSVEIPGIVADYHQRARWYAARAAVSLADMQARWARTHGATYTSLATRWATPQSPPVAPTPPASPGITQPLDNATRGKGSHNDGNQTGAQSPTEGEGGQQA